MLDMFFDRWWRLGGAAGILFIILLIAGIAAQGTPPDYDEPADKIRDWFADNGKQYIVSDYVISLAFVVFFLPFLASLRGLLASAEGGAAVWSRVAFASGLALFVLGAAVSLFWNAMAFGFDVLNEGDEGTVKTLMYLDHRGFATFQMSSVPFLLGASLVIARSGVLWHWLAIIGLAGAVLGALAGLSGLTADPNGGFNIVFYIAGPVTALFILLVSVNMLMKQEAPAAG